MWMHTGNKFKILSLVIITSPSLFLFLCSLIQCPKAPQPWRPKSVSCFASVPSNPSPSPGVSLYRVPVISPCHRTGQVTMKALANHHNRFLTGLPISSFAPRWPVLHIAFTIHRSITLITESCTYGVSIDVHHDSNRCWPLVNGAFVNVHKEQIQPSWKVQDSLGLCTCFWRLEFSCFKFFFEF